MVYSTVLIVYDVLWTGDIKFVQDCKCKSAELWKVPGTDNPLGKFLTYGLQTCLFESVNIPPMLAGLESGGRLASLQNLA